MSTASSPLSRGRGYVRGCKKTDFTLAPTLSLKGEEVSGWKLIKSLKRRAQGPLILNLEADTLSKTAAKRSSSETLLERSAPDADRIDDAKIFPNLISDLLNNGHKARFRAPGYSMYPTILNGDEITVEPIKPEAIRVGDIILYRDKENLIAHRVVKIQIKNDPCNDSQPSVLSTRSCFILRGDARPVCDAPVAAGQILGKVLLIETNGRVINPYAFRAKLTFFVRRVVFRLKRFLN